MNTGDKNWKIIYDKRPELRSFLQTIPREDIGGMSAQDAYNYVMSLKNQIEMDKVKPYQNFKVTNSENSQKYSNYQDRETLHKTSLVSDKNIKLIKSGAPVGEISAKISNDILCHLEKLPTTIYPAVSYNSIKMCRRNILLDTRNRNFSNKKYSWIISNFSTPQLGNVNARDTITQIIEISCNPFRIPIMQNQNVNYYKKIRMGISEMESQAIEIVTNNQYSKREYFHFEFTARQSGDYLELIPVNSWRPTNPIAQCNSITLNFFGNTEQIQFSPDRLLCNYTNTLPCVFTTPEPHNLQTGDLIYVESGELLNDQGYVIAKLSSTTFQILKQPQVIGSVYVYFASRRVQLQMNFVCLEK